MKPAFDEVWSRIVRHEGQQFRQIKGGEFTYTISGNTLVPSRIDRNIARSQLEAAYEFAPLQNTVPIQNLQAPSYLYAILMDTRIRAGQW